MNSLTRFGLAHVDPIDEGAQDMKLLELLLKSDSSYTLLYLIMQRLTAKVNIHE